MSITITDKVGTSGAVTVDKLDVAESIHPWYATGPDWAEAHEAVDKLQTALTRGEATKDLEVFLGIEITR